ncbi:hypothetical protein DV735_g5803, partial [Chaetothyriales sp. CBS 134920]
MDAPSDPSNNDSLRGYHDNGRFTTRVTSPMLTISRVGCLVQTSAITRRDLTGYAELMRPQLRRPVPTDARTHMLEARDTIVWFSESDLQELAIAIASHVDPGSLQLPQRVYDDLVSLNTALFAIQYASQHLNLTEACDEFRQPVGPSQFLDTGIDRNQAGNIFCWGAQFGLYFNISTLDLANKIAAAIYVLQVGQTFSTDLSQLCNYLDIPFAGFLGVNATSIKQNVSSESGIRTSLVPPFWTNSSRSETAAPTITEVDSGSSPLPGGASTTSESAQSDETDLSHSTSATQWENCDSGSVSVSTSWWSATEVSDHTAASSGAVSPTGITAISNGSWNGYTLYTGGTTIVWETGIEGESATSYGLSTSEGPAQR